MTINATALSQSLIRQASISGEPDPGALDVLQEALEGLGFACHRLPFSEEGTYDVDNLYARIGTDGPNLCIDGQTEVEPDGDGAAWSEDPFAAVIQDDMLIGRGAVDMKPAIAAWVAAASRILEQGQPNGSLSLLITGDEESEAINGTQKMLDWLAEQGETMDACIVGEPTNPTKLGEMAKIGRRGSITFNLTVHGQQGHVAYPESADNPITTLMNILHALKKEPIDDGNEFFPPTNLEITTVDVDNPATNVIPNDAKARFNIRFNTMQTGQGLKEWVEKICQDYADKYTLEARQSADAFITKPGRLSDIVVGAVTQVTGSKPELSTTGGTSDARFIKDSCKEVVEFGLINKTAHQVNEQVAVADIERLTDIYAAIISAYFEIN